MENKEKAIDIITVIVSIVNIAYSSFWFWLIFTHNQEHVLMNLVFSALYFPLLFAGLIGLILRKYWKIEITLLIIYLAFLFIPRIFSS